MRAFLAILALIALSVLGLAAVESSPEDLGRYPRPTLAPSFQQPTFISLPRTTAYPGAEFNMRPAVTGGTWPYHFVLSTAPAGMTIDAKTGTVVWQAPATAQTVDVSIALTDLAGLQAQQSFSVTVGTEGFYFVSPDGDDANPGSFEKPWKTVMRAAEEVPNPASATLYLRAGDYVVDVPAAEGKGNANILKIMRTSPRQWIAWPGEKPVIDLGWSEAQWQEVLDKQTERQGDGKYANTQGCGHRILLDHGINGMLFDGLEVKNAAYYMFVMHDGKRSNLTWRRCSFHHLYGDYAENPSFIFTFAPDRKWEPAGPGEQFPFGKRPQSAPYRHLVVQECHFADRPYQSPRGEHGGGMVLYVTQGCLVEDSRFERIQRGQCIIDKDNGWDNTYRNNLFLGDFMLAAQGCNDGINFHHNFVRGTLQIGSQPGWMRNVWIHHNAIRGQISLMGGATRGADFISPKESTLKGPQDPNTQTLIREYPLNERLVFGWANVVIPHKPKGPKAFPDLFRIPDDSGFASKFRFISWDHNLVDEEAQIAIGWAGPRMHWHELKPCGIDVHGETGIFELDEEGRLPANSPWRDVYGRDAGLTSATQ